MHLRWLRLPTFYSAARTKQLAGAPAEEVLALLDSCVVRFHQPYEIDAAPYLLERAQLRVQARSARLSTTMPISMP